MDKKTDRGIEHLNKYLAGALYKMEFNTTRKNSLAQTRLFCETQPGETSQELRMLSSVTLDCQVTKIVMNSGSQL